MINTFFRPISGVVGKSKPWCYLGVVDGDKEWEECNVPMCETPAQEEGEQPPPEPEPPVVNVGTKYCI